VGNSFQDITGKLGAADRAYPVGDTDPTHYQDVQGVSFTNQTRRGWLALGKQISGGNDYLLTIVAYNLPQSSSPHFALLRKVNVDITDDPKDDTVSRLTWTDPADGKYVTDHSPVIFPDGSFAKIDGADHNSGNFARLDHHVDQQNGVDVWVVYEADDQGTPVNIDTSPGIKVVTVRTGLRP